MFQVKALEWLLECKVLVQRFGMLPIDLDFGENREGYSIVIGAEVDNLEVRARLLFLKLVAGEREYHQPLLLVFPVQFLQVEVLTGKPAFARSIDNQQHLAPVVGQRLLGPADSPGAELINVHVGHILSLLSMDVSCCFIRFCRENTRPFPESIFVAAVCQFDRARLVISSPCFCAAATIFAVPPVFFFSQQTQWLHWLISVRRQRDRQRFGGS